MIVREIEAKSILRKNKKIDSWFISHYGMNLYRGCTHNCTYCDGRTEKYRVEGDFGKEVEVKINALDILKRELDPARKRKPFKGGFMMIGGGVGDGYQPLENKYHLTRQALELINHHQLPVHLLTKSTTVIKDLELLKQIQARSRLLVSMSFSSMDDRIGAIFEPGVPPPSERLKTLALFKKEGLNCGVFMLPVIPFITDTADLMEETIQKTSESGLDYLIFGGMTLKEGRQKDYFFETLKKYDLRLIKKYEQIFVGHPWGSALKSYYNSIHQRFYRIAVKYTIPLRIPIHLCHDILDENDLSIVILEHIDYYLKLRGQNSAYGYAAYVISQLKEPLSLHRNSFHNLKGISRAAEQIVIEILDTGRSALYEKLLAR